MYERTVETPAAAAQQQAKKEHQERGEMEEISTVETGKFESGNL